MKTPAFFNIEHSSPVAQATAAGKAVVIDSVELMAGAKLVQIRHGDTHYQLRVTKENKLILTK